MFQNVPNDPEMFQEMLSKFEIFLQLFNIPIYNVL